MHISPVLKQMTVHIIFKQKMKQSVKCEFLAFLDEETEKKVLSDDIMISCSSFLFYFFYTFFFFCRWVSVLQNSKEEALNNAFKGEQDEDENNIVQELSKAIVSEVKRMSGNDVCCDCGAPSK